MRGRENTKIMKGKRKTIIVSFCVLILAICILWTFPIFTYEGNINKRFETYHPTMFKVSDFENLKRTKYEFSSNKGQKLVGYLYSAGTDQKGIIIFAHGFGGGHNTYMDCANYFAQHGYYVFAFDATGNDESGLGGVGGFPQGVIDLDHAISFVEESGNFPDLPIALFGHSWGAYCVCSVLTYHTEVKAVIECCGCNRSTDMFESGGKEQAGNFIYAMMPFVKIHEWCKFGEYASNTSIDGLEASKAAIMSVHSSNDGVVPNNYGYDLYYSKYKDDPRFTFWLFDNRDHSSFFVDQDNTYQDELNSDLDIWCQTLDYDYKAEANKARFAADKYDYTRCHLDREKWSSRLDEEMFERFLTFYNKNLQ